MLINTGKDQAASLETEEAVLQANNLIKVLRKN
jgi:hypothetical protein